MRFLSFALVAMCATVAHAQTFEPISASGQPQMRKPQYLPPVGNQPRTLRNPYIRQTAGNDPIPQPVRSDTQRLSDSISALSRQVDMLQASQMIDNEYPFAQTSCGMEPQAVGCDSCNPQPQVIMVQQAPQTVVTMSEPPEIRQQGRSCLSRSGGTTMTTTSSVAATCAGGLQATTAQAWQWSVSCFDRMRGRTVRQVGPYQITVTPGFFSTEVTVSP